MVSTLLEFLTAWGTECGDVSFLAQFDFNNNCLIDSSDLLRVLADFGNDAVSSVKETFSSKK